MILVSSPRASRTTFISSSASGLTLSTAMMTRRPDPPETLAASSVFSTLTGCTVSPLTRSAPPPRYSRASQSEYALFHSRARPLWTSSSVTPCAPLQVGGPVGDRARGVPDHDHDLPYAHRGEVAQHDVQDRGLARYRQQGLGQLVGVGAEPAAGAGREDEADHRAASPAGSR